MLQQQFQQHSSLAPVQIEKANFVLGSLLAWGSFFCSCSCHCSNWSCESPQHRPWILWKWQVCDSQCRIRCKVCIAISLACGQRKWFLVNGSLCWCRWCCLPLCAMRITLRARSQKMHQVPMPSAQEAWNSSRWRYSSISNSRKADGDTVPS